VPAELDDPSRDRQIRQRDTADERREKELAELRRDKRRLEVEVEILKRAAA
jgi:hypothetical protein